MSDDALGHDGSCLLRVYRRLAESMYFAATCAGLDGCGRGVSISVAKALELMGGNDRRTVRELEARLRCRSCDGKRILISVAVDTRPCETAARDPPPVFRDGMVESGS
jgi:hypothetical protein